MLLMFKVLKVVFVAFVQMYTEYSASAYMPLASAREKAHF